MRKKKQTPEEKLAAAEEGLEDRSKKSKTKLRMTKRSASQGKASKNDVEDAQDRADMDETKLNRIRAIRDDYNNRNK